MKIQKLISWNVNGIRAILKKGFLEWLKKEKPHILALQETKARQEQLDEKILNPDGYDTFWAKPDRPGYSGAAVFSKEKPISVSYGFGIKKFDIEGRVVMLEFEDFYLLNVYFPNGGMSNERLKYKLEFYGAFLKFIGILRKKGKTLVICGDFNTAHKEIDLARPKENEHISGFMPIERKWIDRFLEWGLVDTFRHFNKAAKNYTWWDYKSRARERNVGWRIDYFMIDKKSMPRVKNAFIMPKVMGSDHCPVGISFEM
jgi:exodeoxyribonuclease-3